MTTSTDTPTTNPCIVCSPLAFRRTLAASWPTTRIAGHTVHLGCADRLEFAVEYLTNDLVDRTAEVLRWASSNNCPPDDTVDLWVRMGEITPEQATATAKTRKAETAAFIASYRAAQADVQPSAEELFEMRAAFGPGTTVVDVLTGRRTVL